MAGRNYSEATKLGALELVRQHGVRGAARKCGIDRNTLSRWAREAKVDTSGVQTASQQRQAAAAANASVARRSAQAREAMIGRTLEIVERAQERLAQLIEEGQFVDGKDVRALSDAYIEGQKLVELIEGRATERTASVDETARAEVIEVVSMALRRALELSGLSEQDQRAVRSGFAYCVSSRDWDRQPSDAEVAAHIDQTRRWYEVEQYRATTQALPAAVVAVEDGAPHSTSEEV